MFVTPHLLLLQCQVVIYCPLLQQFLLLLPVLYHTHMYDIYYIILHITIFHMYSIIICIICYLVCRTSSAPVAVSGCYLLYPSPTVPSTHVCIIYTISYIYMCYSYIHIFNYNMCYSYISYHNVTLCALHPHPYYTTHHHQHSQQLTLKL